jgi:hypothetical protein
MNHINTEMNRTATRDSQRYCVANLMHEIAVDMCGVNRRMHLIETHLTEQLQSQKESKHEKDMNGRDKLEKDTNKNSSRETSHWYETATSLSRENSKLVDVISGYELKCARLTISVSRLSKLRTALENDLAAANREIIRLAVCANDFAVVPSLQAPSKARSIPVSADGKDALHWYQTCRSMEAQHIEKINELEAKIDSLIKTMADPDTRRRKRGVSTVNYDQNMSGEAGKRSI